MGLQDMLGSSPTGGERKDEFFDASEALARSGTAETEFFDATESAAVPKLVPDVKVVNISQDTAFGKSEEATKEAKQQARLAEAKMEEALRMANVAEHSQDAAKDARSRKQAAEAELEALDMKAVGAKEKSAAFDKSREEARKKGDEFCQIRNEAQVLHDIARNEAAKLSDEALKVQERKEEISFLEKGIDMLKSTLANVLGSAKHEDLSESLSEVDRLKKENEEAKADLVKAARVGDELAAKLHQAKTNVSEKEEKLGQVCKEIDAEIKRKDELAGKKRSLEHVRETLEAELKNSQMQLGSFMQELDEQEEVLRELNEKVKRQNWEVEASLQNVREKRVEFEKAREAVQLEARAAAQAAREAAAVRGKKEGLLEQARQLEADADAYERSARQAAREAAAAKEEAAHYLARKEALWEEAKRSGSAADRATTAHMAEKSDELASKQAVESV
eukprot:jgi/Botrbrau1/15852/Bobra.40_1s0036.1